MARTARPEGLTLRNAGPELSDELALYLCDGYDLLMDGFADWPEEELQKTWLAHKGRLCQMATRNGGAFARPWAQLVFDEGQIELLRAQSHRGRSLSEDDLAEIRRLFGDRAMTKGELAERYRVPVEQINAVVFGKE